MHRSLVLSGALAAILAFGRSAAAQTPSIPTGPEPGARDTLTLSLSDAQRLALGDNYAFLAERQEVEIARGELLQARVYDHNPELELEAPGAGSGDAFGAYEAALVQEIEWAGQRGLRVRAGRMGVERATSAVSDASRLILAETGDAFYSALAAERRLALTEEVLALNETLLTAVRTQLREGEVSVLAANLAEIDLGRARARALAARREVNEALFELKRLTSLAPDRPVRLEASSAFAPDPALLNSDSLVALALARRPDLEARRAAARQFETLGDLARREAIPNVRLGALAEQDQVGGSPRVGVSVGISLPAFERNQGVIAQRRAQAAQAAFSASAIEQRIRIEVAAALRAYRAASEEAAVFETSVLKPARENRTLLETAYRAGKLDLPSLLLLRNQLLDAELGYWDAWLARREALVVLTAATASYGLVDSVDPDAEISR